MIVKFLHKLETQFGHTTINRTYTDVREIETLDLDQGPTLFIYRQGGITYIFNMNEVLGLKVIDEI